MIRRLVFLTLVTLVAAVPPVWAEEPPYFEFVQGLREKNYTDLALEYLEKLARQPPSEEVARVLPLELAKTRLELAKYETEAGKRLVLYQQARRELDEFLKKNAKHPRAAEAQLELVNVTVLQGKAFLARALRQESVQTRELESQKARQLLQQAGKQLEQAAAKVKEQFDKLSDPKTPQEKADKRALEQAWLQAEYDRGLNLWDIATSYIDVQNVNQAKERSKAVRDAQAVFEQISRYSETIPLCWQAHCWYARCWVELDKVPQARKALGSVISTTGPNMQGPHALARYFLMLIQLQSPEPTDMPLLKAADSWLQNYPGWRNTPEASHVRYLLAEELMSQAGKTKDQPLRRSYLTRARTLYRQLEQTDNDFRERAQTGKIQAIEALGGLNAPINTLQTFDDCYVRAQYEGYLASSNPKKLSGEEWDKQRKLHLQMMEQALNQALKLVDKKVPEQEVTGARSLLAYVYLAREDYKEALRLSEEIARARPLPSQAAAAATHALRAYMQLLADPQKAGLSDEEVAKYREGMRQLTVYMENTWPEEPAGDLARHQLGLMYIQDKDFAKAVEALERVRPSYASIIFARYQLSLAAMQAKEDKVEVPKGQKRSWEERAVAALESLPPLPAGADAEVTRIYLLAKMDLGRAYFRQKKYDALKKLIQPLRDRFDSLALPADQRDDYRGGLESLVLYAEYGLAEAEFSAGRVELAAKQLDALLARVTKGEFPELKKNQQLRWGLLGLALRANVQLGKADRSRAVLDLLRRFAKDDAADSDAAGMLLPMVQLLKEQVQELRKQGDKAKDQLARTVETFELFLDETAKNEKGRTLEVVLFLAQGYSSLDKHDKAAALLAAVPEPKDGDEKKTAYYQAIRILLLRELRLGRDLKKAREVADEILGTPDKPRWGRSNLDALKENNFLLEEEAKYTEALYAWDGMLKTLRPRIDQSGVKDQYLECYFYLTQTYFRYAVTAYPNDAAKRQKAIDKAAKFIVDLEKAHPDFGGDISRARFVDLLQKETLLKEAYEKQKGTGGGQK